MMERTPCLNLDKEVRAFKAHAGKAIFVLFFGVVNHWISVVVHRTAAGAPMEIYMLDSSNIQHLNRPNQDMQNISVEARCWRKLRLGLKPTNRFMCEMSIQSLFDQRSFYQKLAMIFSDQGCLTFANLLTSGQVNQMLRDFHLQTAQFNPNSSELVVPPQSGGFRNHHGEAKEFIRPAIPEETKILFRRHHSEAWFEQKSIEWKMNEYVWDDDQFRFNEKEVSGNYDYMGQQQYLA